MASKPAPTLPNGLPAWENRIVKVLLLAVPSVLAVWHPIKGLDSSTAQTILISVGVVVAAAVHVVQDFTKNGFTLVSLRRAFLDQQSFVEANMTSLQAAVAEVHHLVGNLPASISVASPAALPAQAQEVVVPTGSPSPGPKVLPVPS